jgi:hypothetical protein
MCKLLQFPSPDDPRPKPPASALSVPQPGELSVPSAVSVHALGAAEECERALHPCCNGGRGCVAAR